MKYVLIGGAGFIGTNLAISLCKDEMNEVKIVDRDESYFNHLKKQPFDNISFQVGSFDNDSNFDKQIEGQDVVFHLASTNIPGTSNEHIPEELESNVIVTARLLDACVRQKIKKIVFISSGGAVYGKKGKYPIEETMVTYPITSYGIQKVAIEKLLYLYRYQNGLDYRVVRLANPYGPYQRPNGRLGVITTFIYRAINNEELSVYGDGSVIRDFIYIDDAIKGIINITEGENDLRVFNLGSGKGTSVNEVIDTIKGILRKDLKVRYELGRATDVNVNYLDISRYEKYYGSLNPIALDEGIRRTADFLSKNTIDN